MYFYQYNKADLRPWTVAAKYWCCRKQKYEGGWFNEINLYIAKPDFFYRQHAFIKALLLALLLLMRLRKTSLHRFMDIPITETTFFYPALQTTQMKASCNLGRNRILLWHRFAVTSLHREVSLLRTKDGNFLEIFVQRTSFTGRRSIRIFCRLVN